MLKTWFHCINTLPLPFKPIIITKAMQTSPFFPSNVPTILKLVRCFTISTVFLRFPSLASYKSKFLRLTLNEYIVTKVSTIHFVLIISLPEHVSWFFRYRISVLVLPKLNPKFTKFLFLDIQFLAPRIDHTKKSLITTTRTVLPHK